MSLRTWPMTRKTTDGKPKLVPFAPVSNRAVPVIRLWKRVGPVPLPSSLLPPALHAVGLERLPNPKVTEGHARPSFMMLLMISSKFAAPLRNVIVPRCGAGDPQYRGIPILLASQTDPICTKSVHSPLGSTDPVGLLIPCLSTSRSPLA